MRRYPSRSVMNGDIKRCKSTSSLLYSDLVIAVNVQINVRVRTYSRGVRGVLLGKKMNPRSTVVCFGVVFFSTIDSVNFVDISLDLHDVYSV